MNNISNIKDMEITSVSLLHPELDSLFGSGFILGQVSILAGAAGVGKTRFLTNLLKQIARTTKVLYIQNEFSLPQFKSMYFQNYKGSLFYCSNENSVDTQLAEIEESEAKVVIIDSIQMLEENNTSKNIIKAIQSYKKLAVAKNIHICLICQLNKRGEISGFTSVNHEVDQIFYAIPEKERPSHFRITVTKNRFGKTGTSVLLKHTKKDIKVVSSKLNVKLWLTIIGIIVGIIILWRT